MENALKALLMAAEIIITCIIVALGFRAAGAAKTSAAAGMEAAAVYEKRLAENNYTVYDGTVVSGCELCNIMRYELNLIAEGRGTLAFFEVVTHSGIKLTTPYDMKKVTVKGNAEYISPYDAYRGEAVYKNGILEGMKFTKIQ